MGTVLLPLVAVLAGVISFSSPCCLPLIPGYLSYVSALPIADRRTAHLRDELVNAASYSQTASALDQLGYRYELDQYAPCANPGCSPLFPNHLQLAVNDEYRPAARFLGTHHVDRDPFHVTYVYDPKVDEAGLKVIADHAYWLSEIRLSGDGHGTLNALSHGFGKADAPVNATATGAGALPGGAYLDPYPFLSRKKTWGETPAAPVADAIDLTLDNVSSVTIDPERAKVDCNAALNVTSSAPVTVSLAGCNRVVQAG